eukprot:TRINITY_DN11640_c0_g1_i1.p1 TRINITY_DN11640_c0_g1~~TRINITY_DN11640_c0_g1_i1.p1  ORF type:complete len:361 (-),score=12.62 TRINITY_DN11640_c0_g1_i1:108-1139(-)
MATSTTPSLFAKITSSFSNPNYSILIKDSTKCNGWSVLRHLFFKAITSSRYQDVIFVSLEVLQSRLSAMFGPGLASVESKPEYTKPYLVDCTSDPRGWLKRNNASLNQTNYPACFRPDPEVFSELDDLSKLLNCICALFPPSLSEKKPAVFFDSLSPLLLRHSPELVARFLNLIRQRGAGHVVSIVHQETLLQQPNGQSSFELLAAQSDVLLDMASVSVTAAHAPGAADVVVNLLLKRQSAKVSSAVEELRLEPSGELKPADRRNQKGRDHDEKAASASSHLGFSVELTPEQKAIRDSVVLPFVHRSGQTQPDTMNSIHTSNFTDLPDSDEDIEEDLDADLDI